MKKILLLAATVAALSPAVAQDLRTQSTSVNEVATILATTPHVDITGKAGGFTAQDTAANDSMWYGIARGLYADYAAPLDSGFFYGTNAIGYQGAAQLYYTDLDMAGAADTTVQITGFFSKWAGHVQSTSTKNVTLSIWDRDVNKVNVSTKFYVYGTPKTLKASMSVPAKNLNLTGAANINMLTTPLSGIAYDVYMGFTTSYNWTSLAADTFGIRSTLGGYPNYYSLETGTNDTLLSARTLIQDKTSAWKSVRYNLNVTNGGDIIMAPVYKVSCPTCGVGVGGIRRGDLSFFGNYPNPATSATNIRFGLATTANVTCTVYDNTGRKLSVTDFGTLTIGEHTQQIRVDNLGAGNYVYVLETSKGDIMASQMSVVK